MNPNLDHRQQANPGGRSSLGIYANTVHTKAAPKQKRETRPDDSVTATKRMRFQLQRAAQGLLPQERVKHCQRSTMSSSGVQVFRTADSASYVNLTTCGSVWHCPVCAAKITEGRREDLQQAINAWAKQGGEVSLMSLTYPHQITQGLAENLEKFGAALRKFKNSRLYKNTMTAIGSVGSIRALEVTHGNNGWHPHTHDLIFASKDQLELLQQLQSAWIETLIKVGIADRSQTNDMMQAAFDVRNGDYAAEYVAKFGFEPAEKSKTITGEHWGAARELTKSHAKVGKRLGGRTPFTLLKDYIEGDNDSGALFQEFGLHFKGKRQLFWSPKLRKALALSEEKTDEQIAEEPLPEREFVTKLDNDQWQLVLSRNARFEVLKAAQFDGAQGVAALLEELAGRRATHQGTYFYQEYGGHNYNRPYWVEMQS